MIRRSTAFSLMIALTAVPIASAEPASSGSPGRSIYIAKYDQPTKYQAEGFAVRTAIEKLRDSFRALQPVSRYDQATYRIISPSFAPSDGTLEFTATFETLATPGSAAEPIEASGTSREKEVGSRAIAALDDFLGKTLFNPTRGPYPRIAIEQCLEEQGQLALVVSWSGGPGFEHELAYEVCRPSPFSANLSGEKIFLEIDDDQVTVDEGAGRATIVIDRILRADGTVVDKECGKANLRLGPQGPDERYLRLRLYTPKPKDSSAHDSFTEP